MSLFVTALIITACAASGGLLVRDWRRRSKSRISPRPVSDPREAIFPFRLGDVVSLGDDQIWLERGVLLSEGSRPLASILLAQKRGVLALLEPEAALFRLDEIALSVPSDPPLVLEHEGVAFERLWRRPVSVEPIGKARLTASAEGMLAFYGAGDGSALLLLTRALADRGWVARRAGASEIERWGHEAIDA